MPLRGESACGFNQAASRRENRLAELVKRFQLFRVWESSSASHEYQQRTASAGKASGTLADREVAEPAVKRCSKCSPTESDSPWRRGWRSLSVTCSYGNTKAVGHRPRETVGRLSWYLRRKGDELRTCYENGGQPEYRLREFATHENNDPILALIVFNRYQKVTTTVTLRIGNKKRKRSYLPGDRFHK